MNAKKAWMRCLTRRKRRCLTSKLDRKRRRIGKRTRMGKRLLKIGHSVLFLNFCTMAIMVVFLWCRWSGWIVKLAQMGPI